MAKTNSSEIANQKEETTWTDFMNFLYVNRGKVAWLIGSVLTILYGGYRAGRMHERYLADKELIEIRRVHDKELQKMSTDMLLIKIDSKSVTSSREVTSISETLDEQ